MDLDTFRKSTSIITPYIRNSTVMELDEDSSWKYPTTIERSSRKKNINSSQPAFSQPAQS